MGFMTFRSPWERDHAGFIVRSMRYQDAHDGALPETRAWTILERRFDRAQARFEFWHPTVAAMIRESRLEVDAPVLPPAPPVDPGFPAMPVVPNLPPGGPPQMQQAAEPSALVLGAAAAIVFIVARVVRGRRGG